MVHDRRLRRPSRRTGGKPMTHPEVSRACGSGCARTRGMPARRDRRRRHSRSKRKKTSASSSRRSTPATSRRSSRSTRRTPRSWRPAIREPSATQAIRALVEKESAGLQAGGITLVLNDDDKAAASGELGYHSGSYVVKDASGATIDSGNYLGGDAAPVRRQVADDPRHLELGSSAAAAAAEPAAEAPAA